MQFGQEPEITKRDPQAYYYYLQQMGMSPYQAAQQVQSRFGPGKTPEQRAKEQASKQQNQALAQTGGAVGGMLLTREALAGFPNVTGLFSSAPAAVETPTLLGGSSILGGGSAAASGSTVATPTLIGAKTVGASGAGAGAAGSTTLGSVGAYALPVAAVVAALSNAWETGGKDILRGRGNKEDWINQGVNIAFGGIPNIASRMLGGRSIGRMMTSGKGDAQLLRDDIRGFLKEQNIIDEKYQGTLADGSTYDFGKDGSELKWKNIDKIAEANPNSWSSVVPLTDALSTSYGLVGQKASDVSAWYAKSAVSNANDDPAVAIANARHFAAQQGITFDGIKQKLDEAMADNRLSQSQYDYYLNGARQLTSGLPTPQQQNNRQNIQPKGPAPLPTEDQQKQQQIEKYKQFRI